MKSRLLNRLVAIVPAFGLAMTGAALAASPIAMSVGADETLKYPAGMETLADEHTTIIPLGPSHYRFFAASKTTGSGFGYTGAVVLDTNRNLVKFQLAPTFGDPALGGLVLASPSTFTDCSFPPPSSFEQNYAAPGTVVHDPSQPPGNMIMIYEAEQHCDGTTWNHNFYASIGFARSPDHGRTWPKPAPESTDRYAILQVAGPQPITPGAPNMGNALPSAFVDTVPRPCRVGHRCPPPAHFLYVLYTNAGNLTTPPDGYLRVARAELGQPDPIAFDKWYNGAWNGEGLGGLDSPVTTSKGCGTAAAQLMSQISYNDSLQLYMLTFVCLNVSNGVQTQGAWYFATASSLELQNWSTPVLIAGSQFPVSTACAHGTSFDGWYPSFMSPGHKEGHIGLTGKVFFMCGCDGALGRAFKSRSFTITGGS